MKSSTHPFVVSCGNPSVRALDLVKLNGEITLFKEKDTGMSYKRQKPVELYSQLIEVFSKDKCLHIIDACSGAGSCALAISEQEMHYFGKMSGKGPYDLPASKYSLKDFGLERYN